MLCQPSSLKLFYLLLFLFYLFSLLFMLSVCRKKSVFITQGSPLEVQIIHPLSFCLTYTKFCCVFYSSLEALHKKLLSGELLQLKKDQIVYNRWCSEPEIVSAVWMLVGMCDGNDWMDIRELLADFISRVIFLHSSCVCVSVLAYFSCLKNVLLGVQTGIVDPHHVVFDLPYDSVKMCPSQMIAVETDIVMSNTVLAELLALLKKYLMDDSVNIIDLASRTLQVNLCLAVFQKI